MMLLSLTLTPILASAQEAERQVQTQSGALPSPEPPATQRVSGPAV